MKSVTIQISSKPVLTLPKPLSKQLGVREGEKVGVQVRNGGLQIRRNGHKRPPERKSTRNGLRTRPHRVTKLTDLIGAIPGKPGEPKIDFEELMSHHGYEQLERPGRDGY